MTNDPVLERLKRGARRFQTEIYGERAAEYKRAASTPQQPHTLVIACADSRVNVESITGSGPGEVFVTRSLGNMVPAFGTTVGAVAAVIEYAVSALRVRHAVICGHSDCGAMKGLLDPESTAGMPAVQSWLRHGEAVLGMAGMIGSGKLRQLTEENVLLQMAHLRTHPSVAAALAGGELTLSGWVYEIGTGEMRIAEGDSREFVVLSGE